MQYLSLKAKPFFGKYPLVGIFTGRLFFEIASGYLFN